MGKGFQPCMRSKRNYTPRPGKKCFAEKATGVSFECVGSEFLHLLLGLEICVVSVLSNVLLFEGLWSLTSNGFSGQCF